MIIFTRFLVLLVILVLMHSKQEISALDRNLYLTKIELFPSLFPKSGLYVPTNYPQGQAPGINATTSAYLKPILNCPWALDICTGTAGNDKMFGSNQADYILSSSGDDYILGWNGSDYLNGGGGNDIINGGEGGDVIEGGNGEDILNGGPGNDIIFAGQENGKILPVHVNSTEFPPSKDIIDCGEGNDAVYVDGLDVYKNCEVVNGLKQSPITSDEVSNPK